MKKKQTKKQEEVSVQKNAVVLVEKIQHAKKRSLLQRAVLFIGVMGLSFASTVILIRLTPWFMEQIRQLSKLRLPVKTEQRKLSFSGNEAFTHMDPVLLKEYIDLRKEDVLIIDTRSVEEYRAGHIKYAASIPLYTDFRRPYESVSDKNKWVTDIKKQGAGKREIVVYGYRPDADILLVAVDILRKQQLSVKILSVGYGDWQGGFWSWIPGGELNTSLNINDYIERATQ